MNKLNLWLWPIQKMLHAQELLLHSLEFEESNLDWENLKMVSELETLTRKHNKRIKKSGGIPRHTNAWATNLTDPEKEPTLAANQFLTEILNNTTLDAETLFFRINNLPEGAVEQAYLRVKEARAITAAIEDALPILQPKMATPPKGMVRNLLFNQWEDFGRREYLQLARNWPGIDGKSTKE